MKSTGKPAEILSKLNELAGYAPDEEIDLYEVCCSNICFKNLFIIFSQLLD